MNVFLLQKGYPLVIILKNDRKRYYRVLQEADDGNTKPLVEFVAKAVERSLDIYLNLLTPSAKNKEKYIIVLHMLIIDRCYIAVRLVLNFLIQNSMKYWLVYQKKLSGIRILKITCMAYTNHCHCLRSTMQQ